MVTIESMEVMLACKTQNNCAEDFSLTRVRGIVDHSGKEIQAFKKKPGIRNFLVVVNSQGVKFEAKDISKVISDHWLRGYAQPSIIIKRDYLIISSNMHASETYKIIPLLQELLS